MLNLNAMKIVSQLCIYLICIGSLNGQCPVPEIISPNGGEELTSGSLFEVEFDYGPFGPPLENWDVNQVFFYYSIDGGTNWILEDTILIDTSTISSDPIINYQWLVPEVNSDDCLLKISRYEDACWDESDNSFIISPLLSISFPYASEREAISIFPNPVVSGQEINVKLDLANDITRIELIDRKGQIVRNYPNEKGNLKILSEHLHEGVYFLLIRYSDKVETKRIVIKK